MLNRPRICCGGCKAQGRGRSLMTGAMITGSAATTASVSLLSMSDSLLQETTARARPDVVEKVHPRSAQLSLPGMSCFVYSISLRRGESAKTPLLAIYHGRSY